MISYIGTVLFAIAILHIFCVSYIGSWAHLYSRDSIAHAFLHLLSEVEVVFGFWSFVFLSIWAALRGLDEVIHYQESLNMTEPLFIFCIMIMASTKPVVQFAMTAIGILSRAIARVIPVNMVFVQFMVLMSIGPLTGSFITEPAAITIVALLLLKMLKITDDENPLLYPVLGLLFVNVSIGGALTHFAAPPILVVARTWNWGLVDVFTNLGVAALVSVFVNCGAFFFFFRKKILSAMQPLEISRHKIPAWVTAVHILFIILMVISAHHSQFFMGIFLIFMGVTTVTKQFQETLKFRESLLVAFFLSGLIIFGPQQKWWLEQLLSQISEQSLFFGAAFLTSFTDNAALTFLASQISGLSAQAKWAVVAGALVGGGMTILANAPNPAGFSILSSRFKDGSLNALKLMKAAFLPTIISIVVFYIECFVR